MRAGLKLGFTSFLIRALRRARKQLPGCPLLCPDRAGLRTCGAPGQRPGSMYECRGVGGLRLSMPPAPCQHVEGCTHPWRDATCPGSGHLLARRSMKNVGSYHRLSLWASLTRHGGRSDPAPHGVDYGGPQMSPWRHAHHIPWAIPIGTRPHMEGLRHSAGLQPGSEWLSPLA